MLYTKKTLNLLATFITLLTLGIAAMAAEPVFNTPTTAEASDIKPGSLLVWNLYTSSVSGANSDNTRISITNANSEKGVSLHLFFVEGATGTVADGFICLSASHTVTLFMDQIDPGVTGYLVAVAIDGPSGYAGGNNTGRPISWNYLIGDEYVKFGNTYEANLSAISFSVVGRGDVDVNPESDPFSSLAELIFDGKPGHYNRMPRVVAISNIPSPADSLGGEDPTQIVINRVSGDFTAQADKIGNVFGYLFDDMEKALGYTFNVPSPQFRSPITPNFPRTTPRSNIFVPNGRTGWMKLFSPTLDSPMLGSVIYGKSPNGFRGHGHNMHHLTLVEKSVITIPAYPAGCF